MRRCRTCLTPKPVSEYDSPSARRCSACRLLEQTCAVCGDPTVLGRKTCGHECELVMRARAGEVGGLESGRRRRAATMHTCPHCAVPKRRDADNFYAAVRDRDTGEVVRFDTVCKPCKRAEQRDKYATMPERRERHLAAAQRQRQRLLERRATDPQFDAEWRDRVRRWNATHRHKTEPEPTGPGPGGTKLPALPLAVALERIVAQREVDHDDPRESVCSAAGIAVQQLTRWGTGTLDAVSFSVADRVLQGLALFWWEVWPERDYPEVQAAFAG